MRYSRTPMNQVHRGRTLGTNAPNSCEQKQELEKNVKTAQKYIDSACGRKFCNQACDTNKPEGWCALDKKVTEYAQQAKQAPQGCQQEFCNQVCN